MEKCDISFQEQDIVFFTLYTVACCKKENPHVFRGKEINALKIMLLYAALWKIWDANFAQSMYLYFHLETYYFWHLLSYIELRKRGI